MEETLSARRRELERVGFGAEALGEMFNLVGDEVAVLESMYLEDFALLYPVTDTFDLEQALAVDGGASPALDEAGHVVAIVLQIKPTSPRRRGEDTLPACLSALELHVGFPLGYPRQLPPTLTVRRHAG